MTLETHVANIIWTAVSIVALWAVGRFFVIPAIRDTLRHKLFAVRREMFLFMATGNIDANHRAYGSVRVFMNAAIRYADGLSLTRALIGFVVAGSFGKERINAAERAISSLPEPARTQISTFRQRAARMVGIYVLVRSPLGWALAVLAVPLTIVVVAVSALRSAWARTWANALAMILAKRAEQETQILACIEEEGAAAAA